MKWRLFLDIEVIEFLKTVRPRVRERLFAVFDQIRDHPEHCREFTETDATGRDLSGMIREGFAIFFWDDFADRHVKIMRVTPADR